MGNSNGDRRVGKPVSGVEDKGFTSLENGETNKILSFQAVDGA
jgi:hypothetical protein